MTLTPPLANAMLMAEGIVESGDGWTLFDDGKLTVTDKMASDDIPPAIWNAVTSIEVTGDAYLYLWSSFSGGITVKAGGSLTNSSNATLSADVTLDGGRLENLGTVTGSVTVKAGGELFSNFTGKLSCDVTVETGGSFQNHGTITGGDFSGQVYNNKDGTITGGDFSGQVYNSGTIQKGTFVGTVTNTGTIADGTFNGQVNHNDGEIKGGTFNGQVVLKGGEITGGTFSAEVQINSSGCTITSGNFTGATVTSSGTIKDGTSPTRR